MNKELIDRNVLTAIDIINKQYDFNAARQYINNALLEVGSNRKLAYYDVLRNILIKLFYDVRGFSKKAAVKSCYTNLLHYYQEEFVNIQFVDIDATNVDEMTIANSICVDMVNNIAKFAQGMRQFYVDVGFFTALGNNNKYMNEFMPIILKSERAAYLFLSRYSNKSAAVEKNIQIWKSEVEGKYGRKYL